jgi:hypothetical protein
MHSSQRAGAVGTRQHDLSLLTKKVFSIEASEHFTWITTLVLRKACFAIRAVLLLTGHNKATICAGGGLNVTQRGTTG